MKQPRRAVWLLGASLCAPFGALGTAVAAPAAGADEVQLEEVLVTAEKRESTVQKTPISITAISGEDLVARGLTSVLAVAQETPGISFRSAGSGQTEFEMRGLGSAGGAAATVGFYVDETPISPPAFGGIGKVVIDPDLYDLQRIEVLRGPQGTLYGAGSMGGTIKLVTNRPVLNEFQGSASATLSATDGGGFNRGGNLMLNIPLANDLLALRLVASSKYTDGWLDRIVVSPFPLPTNDGCADAPFPAYGCTRGDVTAGPITAKYRRVNWQRVQSFRPSLLITPADDWTINLSALYQRSKQGGYSNFDLQPGDAPTGRGHYQPFDDAEPFSDIVRLASAVVDYDGPSFKLTSATSFWNRAQAQTQDAAELIQSLLFVPELVRLPYTETDRSEQFSEELRISSTGDQSFHWLGGVFYSDFKYQFYQNVASAYFADFGAGGAAENPDGQLYVATIPYDVKQSAVFAEGSYQFTPAWKLTAGLRFFNYKSDVNANQAGIFTQNGNATPTIVSVTTKDDGFSPKLNLAYTPSDNLTVYATASKGFRPGGVSQPLPIDGPGSCAAALAALGRSANDFQFKPDSIWNYELGEKLRLLGGRLTVNADVFYIRWDDVQQFIPLSCGSILNTNAGTARSYGSELEVSAKLTHAFTLTMNGAYTNSKISDPSSFSGIAPGTPVLNIPKYTAGAALLYTVSVWNDNTFTARVSHNITGPQWDAAYLRSELPSYALTALRLGLSNAQWTTTLFVDNLTNKQAVLGINNTTFTGNIPSLTRATSNQPRTVGADLQYRF